MTVSGLTAVYLMLADPVAQARSPTLFNELCAREGIDAVMLPLQVAPEGFESFWRSLSHVKNLRGMIVSIPFKGECRRLADRAGPSAALIGTANAVRREPDGAWLCENFDGAGFALGLRRHGHEVAGRRALLVGAGGAGSAIAFALAEGGAAALTIADADAARAAALAERVTAAYPRLRAAVGPPDPAGQDIAVNATPMGMRPDDPFPMEVARLRPQTTVVDIVMKPRETPLLRRAAEIGCPVQYGNPMTDCQMELWCDFLRLREQPRVSPAAPA